VSACDTEAGLSAFGRVSTYGQLLQLLKNRLLVTDTLSRHPEIDDVEIRRPIIIAGLPRTGTTHLHNLLAADPARRSLPYWESLEPVLAPAEQPGPGQPDPRIARADAGVTFLNQAMPYFKRMHEMTSGHVHEEIHCSAWTCRPCSSRRWPRSRRTATGTRVTTRRPAICTSNGYSRSCSGRGAASGGFSSLRSTSNSSSH
jgi:hypothetical protein